MLWAASRILNLLPDTRPCGLAQTNVEIPVEESYVGATLTLIDGAILTKYWPGITNGSPEVWPIAIWFFAGISTIL